MKTLARSGMILTRKDFTLRSDKIIGKLAAVFKETRYVYAR